MKLKTRIKLAYKMLTKGKIEFPNNKVEVVIISDNESSVESALGLERSRVEYLTKRTQKMFDDNLRVSNIMSEMSKECVHANELAVVVFNLGVHIGRLKYQMNMFREIMGGK